MLDTDTSIFTTAGSGIQGLKLDLQDIRVDLTLPKIHEDIFHVVSQMQFEIWHGPKSDKSKVKVTNDRICAGMICSTSSTNLPFLKRGATKESNTHCTMNCPDVISIPAGLTKRPTEDQTYLHYFHKKITPDS